MSKKQDNFLTDNEQAPTELGKDQKQNIIDEGNNQQPQQSQIQNQGENKNEVVDQDLLFNNSIVAINYDMNELQQQLDQILKHGFGSLQKKDGEAQDVTNDLQLQDQVEGGEGERQKRIVEQTKQIEQSKYNYYGQYRFMSEEQKAQQQIKLKQQNQNEQKLFEIQQQREFQFESENQKIQAESNKKIRDQREMTEPVIDLQNFQKLAQEQENLQIAAQQRIEQFRKEIGQKNLQKQSNKNYEQNFNAFNQDFSPVNQQPASFSDLYKNKHKKIVSEEEINSKMKLLLKQKQQI